MLASPRRSISSASAYEGFVDVDTLDDGGLDTELAPAAEGGEVFQQQLGAGRDEAEGRGGERAQDEDTAMVTPGLRLSPDGARGTRRQGRRAGAAYSPSTGIGSNRVGLQAGDVLEPPDDGAGLVYLDRTGRSGRAGHIEMDEAGGHGVAAGPDRGRSARRGSPSKNAGGVGAGSIKVLRGPCCPAKALNDRRRRPRYWGQAPPWAIGTVVTVVAALGHGIAIESMELRWARAVAHVLGVLCAALSLANLYMVWYTDPGVIAPGPRCKDVVDVCAPPLLPPGLGEDPTIQADSAGAFTRAVEVKRRDGGTTKVTYRWCHTCDTWRGPRAHHCSVCGFCIDRFDHHCPVVGNCVAKGTHRFFTAFLLIDALGCLVYAVAASVALHEIRFNLELGKTYVLLLIAVVCFYLFFALLVFGFSHAWMLCVSDTTTKDIIKGNRNMGELLPRQPLRELLCAPVRSKRRWPVRESPFGRPADGLEHGSGAPSLPSEDTADPLAAAELGMAIGDAGSGGQTVGDADIGIGSSPGPSTPRRSSGGIELNPFLRTLTPGRAQGLDEPALTRGGLTSPRSSKSSMSVILDDHAAAAEGDVEGLVEIDPDAMAGY